MEMDYIYIMDILKLFPSTYEVNLKQKAYFLGYMVRELLDVSISRKKITDRDSFVNKTVDLSF